MSSVLLLPSVLRAVHTGKGTVGCMYQCVAGYAAKKTGPVLKKKKKFFDTETDPEKLCNNLCGGNIYKEGEDPKLGPDSVYPHWIWDLRTEKKQVPIKDLSPDTWEYWRSVKKIARKRKNFYMKKYKV